MDYLTKHTKVYDNLAEEYEQKALVTLSSFSNIVNFFSPNVTSGKDVLDIGCGVGMETKLLCDKGFNVIAIDLSPKMVEHTKKRNPEAKVIQGDFLQYSFDRKFDGIFSIAFIHLFPKKDAIKVFEKMFFLLKKDGAMYLTTPLFEKSEEGWELKNDKFFPNSRQVRYKKHWTESELHSTLLDVGFVLKDKRVVETDPRGKKWVDFVVRKP